MKYLPLLILFCIPLFFLLTLFGISVRNNTPKNQEAIFNAVNSWRVENGMTAFAKDENLCDYASLRIDQINEFGFSHDLFRKELPDFMYENSFANVGENLFEGTDRKEKVILLGWLNSPTHRENIEYNWDSSCVRCDSRTCVQIFAEEF